ESSSPTEIRIAYFASDNAADGGVADGGGGVQNVPLHVSLTMTSLSGWPPLPVGARVWLTKDPAGEPPPVTFLAPANEAVTVRDKKGGRLLVAAALNKPTAIEIAQGSESCTEVYGACMETYWTLLVHGDTEVLVRSGETATVPIGGVACDVSVYEISTSGTNCGGDVPLGTTTRVGIKAQDLAAAGAKLDVGAAP
ncbi:MAG TPA: hypothetical protein VHL80_03665, partial [Polyangia bacterium]|nr:hypothetical protein [Polyangia bacterium]